MNFLRRIHNDHTLNKDQELAKLAKRLQDKQAELHKQHDIDSDPTTEIKCTVCNDIGWIAQAYEYGTKAILCPNMCDARARNETRRQYTIIEKTRLQSITGRDAPPLRVRLADYTPQTDYQTRALGITETYINGNLSIKVDGRNKSSLVFVGQWGSGKTHLASALANELELLGYNIWYMKFGEMIRRINDCYDDSINTTPFQVIKALQHIDVLILDDVGRNHSTGSTKDLFFDIMDARYDLNRPTILTTNLYPDQIGSTFDMRVQSRLQDIAHCIQLDGNVRDTTGVL